VSGGPVCVYSKDTFNYLIAVGCDCLTVDRQQQVRGKQRSAHSESCIPAPTRSTGTLMNGSHSRVAGRHSATGCACGGCMRCWQRASGHCTRQFARQRGISCVSWLIAVKST
jgi:hypothetical protein